MTIATVSELASYLQRDLDTASAQLALDIVEAEIAAVFGGTLPSPAPGVAKGIELAAAGRIFSNPQGLDAETAGPFSRTFGAPGALTVDELARLGRAKGTSYTVTMAGPDPVETVVA